MSTRKKPARWRKARNPNRGGRWGNLINQHSWHRKHGTDIELWRGEQLLAVVKPASTVTAPLTSAGFEPAEGCGWLYRIASEHQWYPAADESAAKAQAKCVAEAVS